MAYQGSRRRSSINVESYRRRMFVFGTQVAALIRDSGNGFVDRTCELINVVRVRNRS